MQSLNFHSPICVICGQQNQNEATSDGLESEKVEYEDEAEDDPKL